MINNQLNLMKVYNTLIKRQLQKVNLILFKVKKIKNIFQKVAKKEIR